MRKRLTSTQVRNVLSCDACSRQGDVITVRRGFYYTHGCRADDLAIAVVTAFPDAVVLESREVWKPFRGGAPVAQSSHWFVRFTLKRETEAANG